MHFVPSFAIFGTVKLKNNSILAEKLAILAMKSLMPETFPHPQNKNEKFPPQLEKFMTPAHCDEVFHFTWVALNPKRIRV